MSVTFFIAPIQVASPSGRVRDDLVLARLDRAHVDAHLARVEAVVAAAARHVGGVGAGDQRSSWGCSPRSRRCLRGPAAR
jgi:hypothetical protein